ncbi:MAG: sugar ABC transporter ATP-binding protein [Fimbriimonadales bacterium]
MPTIAVKTLTVEFPGVRALNSVSLSFSTGEVHGIIGENGAGKSTLMRVLSGLQQPTDGELLLDGNSISIPSVRAALKYGIAIIHQELNLVDDLTVAENIFLGREPTKLGIVNEQSMETEASWWLGRVGAEIRPSALVRDLRIAQKQFVEIAKALSYRASVLIMDEPTAVLTEVESEKLFGLIAQLKEDGVTVLYVSHRLEEVERVCDRISVLRDGNLVTTVTRGEATVSDMASFMVGRPLEELYPPKREFRTNEVAMAVENLSIPQGPRNISFQLKRGEILGFAGLIGSGRTEVAEAIFGVRKASSGKVLVEGKAIRIMSAAESLKNGIAYVSEDRKALGLHLALSATENITLVNLRAYAAPLLSASREVAGTEKWITQLDIRLANPSVSVKTLSGGNQQKVAIAKWLDSSPSIVILDEPTRGVDIGAKREIYQLIHRLVSNGMSCILISSEMQELVGLCDRVIVMREGEMSGELSGEEITEQNIMRLAAGVEAA